MFAHPPALDIAVLGAGPVGIEAAVAAQAGGHRVIVYEAGEAPAWCVGHWSHVQMFTPWHMNTSLAGRQVLGDPATFRSEACPTGATLRDEYLVPLTAGLGLRTSHRVVGVARLSRNKGQDLGSQARSSEPFRLLVRTPDGEISASADVILDCTGTFEDPAPAGQGGLPVPGEQAAKAAGRLVHGPVDPALAAGKRVAVVGDGASATTAVVGMRPVAANVVWFTRSPLGPGFTSPDGDVLPGRRALFLDGIKAAQLVEHRPGQGIQRMDLRPGGLRLTLDEGQAVVVDMVVVATGFRPDNSILRELQFHQCWGTEGPMKLAAHLLSTRGGGGGDCLAQPSAGGVEVLTSPEPLLFVLGSKSFGRRSDFLLQQGHEQIQQVMASLAAAGA